MGIARRALVWMMQEPTEWTDIFADCYAPDGYGAMGLAPASSVAALVYACRALAERCAALEARVRTLEARSRPVGQ